MEQKEVLLTYEGLKKLEEELEYLKGEKRKEIAERIKAALTFGDISENSEYDEAKNEQAQNEARIVQLETMLKRATIIDEDEVDTQMVNLGTYVRIREQKSKDEFEYHIVGSAEADPASFKISNESPVGRALMGHKIGDVVEVEVPGGKLKYKIIDIHK
ncbi:MAG TPA: transcription elongation factor GreA [Thermoclostridium caenicola]|uniref:transcription elongation factor GreA n=1 Tax=Thermoclostridium caenicola TaxID=659425 RepID=UPI002BEC74FC|nr:transcription elongation factor GreA [Thermoclostridium caenicola]HOK43748.1 transcription elongation factor GreA [Thermoclostridium caenicola]HOL84211.1 transcription elongation factor GreA [Thermoclostridium caenicola]HOP71787.1 transcription elongation factor GreA [Thermoclostridium caenicola]HPO75770.1 transcription elongation factor GreA [Thermoclostridium caenicola]HPU22118.1 transcription elongation factor GreA [Thermoclostridium caenicola]